MAKEVITGYFVYFSTIVWGIHEAVMQYKTNKNSANLK
jgi:hypothetical protein